MVVLIGVPETATVRRIDERGAIVAPARRAKVGLAPAPCLKHCFALRQVV